MKNNNLPVGLFTQYPRFEHPLLQPFVLLSISYLFFIIFVVCVVLVRNLFKDSDALVMSAIFSLAFAGAFAWVVIADLMEIQKSIGRGATP